MGDSAWGKESATPLSAPTHSSCIGAWTERGTAKTAPTAPTSTPSSSSSMAGSGRGSVSGAATATVAALRRGSPRRARMHRRCACVCHARGSGQAVGRKAVVEGSSKQDDLGRCEAAGVQNGSTRQSHRGSAAQRSGHLPLRHRAAQCCVPVGRSARGGRKQPRRTAARPQGTESTAAIRRVHSDRWAGATAAQCIGADGRWVSF